MRTIRAYRRLPPAPAAISHILRSESTSFSLSVMRFRIRLLDIGQSGEKEKGRDPSPGTFVGQPSACLRPSPEPKESERLVLHPSDGSREHRTAARISLKAHGRVCLAYRNPGVQLCAGRFVVADKVSEDRKPAWHPHLRLGTWRGYISSTTEWIPIVGKSPCIWRNTPRHWSRLHF